MNCTEDQFRSILHEEAADITADSIPPLSLPDASPHRLLGAGSRRRRWLVPLGAAAAVTAIAVAATVFAGGSRAPRPDAAAPSLWHGVPAYYFAVTCSGRCVEPPEAVVLDTRTGVKLATARSPKGCRFWTVAAAADDRTFAISCFHGLTARLFLARFDPATGRLSVTAMHLPQIPNFLGKMALSQDGTSIATLSQYVRSARAEPEVILRVYSSATGTVRIWSGAGDVLEAGGLSWGPGPLLAFGYNTAIGPAGSSIRLLNTNSPSGSLLGASRVAVPQSPTGGYAEMGGFAVSGNGARVSTGLIRTYRHSIESEFAEFSTATDRALRRWDQFASEGYSVFWSDFTGKILVAAFPGHGSSRFGIMTGERFTPLPQMPKNTLSVAF
jgi:hypothetical protein